MKRTFTYNIPTEYEGKKIYEFLRDKGFSRQNLTDIRFKNYVLSVGNERVYRNHILSQNDILTVEIDEIDNSKKIPPIDIPLEIIYEDEDVLVVNKPAGMPVHPSLNHYENTLGNAVMYYYNSRGESFVYRCINRLDRDTSGLTIIAKNCISSNILGRQQKNNEIYKEYYAVVEGEDVEEAGTVDLPIGRLPGSTIERIVDYEHGKEAVTHYETIRRNNGLALVKLHLETGRTHQIRVHMKAIGHPLVGDFLYNPNNSLLGRQALHVGRLVFFQPYTGKKIELWANIPQDMEILC